MRIESSSPSTTRLLAKILAEELSLHPPRLLSATVIALEGPLGSGKTSFAQAFGRALGIPQNLPSPTFTLIRRYIIRKGPYHRLFHLDAYRLKNGSAKTLSPLGIAEELENPKNLFLIEWANRIRPALPRHLLRISFRHSKQSPTSRTLTIRSR